MQFYDGLRGQGGRAERRARHPLDHKFQVDGAVREVKQALNGELRLEFLGEQQGALRPYTKRNDRSRISEKCIADVWFRLMYALTHEHQPHTILAPLAHHLGKHERREVLELVELEEEQLPSVWFGFCSGEGREAYGRTVRLPSRSLITTVELGVIIRQMAPPGPFQVKAATAVLIGLTAGPVRMHGG